MNYHAGTSLGFQQLGHRSLHYGPSKPRFPPPIAVELLVSDTHHRLSTAPGHLSCVYVSDGPAKLDQAPRAIQCPVHRSLLRCLPTLFWRFLNLSPELSHHSLFSWSAILPAVSLPPSFTRFPLPSIFVFSPSCPVFISFPSLADLKIDPWPTRCVDSAAPHLIRTWLIALR